MFKISTKSQYGLRAMTYLAKCKKKICPLREISNGEGISFDYLEKIIPGAVQISGRDTLERKEDKLIDFSNGNIQTLITKPKMRAWGLNWQHCNHAIFFPSHSYEQYYQAVRRFYRFGQKRKVYIDMVTTEGEAIVYKNVKRKAKQADQMFTQLVKYMNDYHEIKAKAHNNYKINLPQWI